MRAKLQIAFVAFLMLGGLAYAPVASAQSGATQTKPKILKFKGTVLSSNSISITLADQQNPKMVQSFSYSPEVKQQIASVIQNGGFQHGDKVTVDYAAGTSVALHIHGKPSKTP